MTFDAIIGQDIIKRQLRLQLSEGRIPHAQLFCGPEGSGKLPLALAFATALLCRDRKDAEPCGVCNDCKMMQRFTHPDLHFVFPAYKKKPDESDITKARMSEWYELLSETIWFNNIEWNKRLGLENQQTMIYEAQIDELVNELSLSAQKPNGYKVTIIWQADKMNLSAANKILKTLEEPTPRTVIILMTDKPEKLLPTILSRVQTLEFQPFRRGDLEQMLQQQNGLSEEDARHIAHASRGSYLRAQTLISVDAETGEFFQTFVELMRKCYARQVDDLFTLATDMAGWGRERLKRFLQYCQSSVRENFIYNLGSPELNYQTAEEAAFSTRFARFINEKNVEDMTRELSDAERDIEGNVNARIVLSDLFLKLIVLILRK